MGTYGVLRLGTSEFLFDVEDLPLIENRDWYRDKDGYLVNCYYYNGRRRFTRFHRIVMHAKPKQFVDHINRNRAGKWVANISYNRKRVFLGRFELKEDAVAARLAKEKELFKEYSPQIPVVEV